MTIYSANKTSATLLVEYASEKWGAKTDDSGSENEQRFLMIFDLYIKARSYALINKASFWLSIMTGLAVLVWPSLTVLLSDFSIELEFFQSAIVQTTVTGIAALAFALYSHYKTRQVHFETLMRRAIYEKNFDDSFRDLILAEVEKLDTGFRFGEVTRERKDSQKNGNKKP